MWITRFKNSGHGCVMRASAIYSRNQGCVQAALSEAAASVRLLLCLKGFEIGCLCLEIQKFHRQIGLPSAPAKLETLAPLASRPGAQASPLRSQPGPRVSPREALSSSLCHCHHLVFCGLGEPALFSLPFKVLLGAPTWSDWPPVLMEGRYAGTQGKDNEPCVETERQQSTEPGLVLYLKSGVLGHGEAAGPDSELSGMCRACWPGHLYVTGCEGDQRDYLRQGRWVAGSVQ